MTDPHTQLLLPPASGDLYAKRMASFSSQAKATGSSASVPRHNLSLGRQEKAAPSVLQFVAAGRASASRARASFTAPWVLSLVCTARRYSFTARSRCPGHIKDPAKLHVTPNLRPARIAVTPQRIAEAVRRGLIVSLLEETPRRSGSVASDDVLFASSAFWYSISAAVRSPCAACCCPRSTATRTARSGVLFSSQPCGSIVIRRGRPKVSTV